MNHSHPQLGRVVTANRVINEFDGTTRVSRSIWLVAGCVALMMTGYGLIIPIFARRLEEFGSGVQAMGLMLMAFALAQLLMAPVLGSVADRHGRRPVILLALAAFALANVGFLLVRSTEALIIVRALEGAFTAGLFPSAMGLVADVVPENQRGRWAGIVMGSYAIGFVLGPVAGGLLYDHWGFVAPFLGSAVMACLALIAASILVPETRTPALRWRENLQKRRDQANGSSQKETIWNSLPRPLTVFGMLLVVDFVLVFAFAFVEPQMVFYLYDDLGWTTVQFGMVFTCYGAFIVLGQGLFGQMSDRFGRKPIIIIGLLLHMTFYIGLALTDTFWVLILVSLVAGLGESMVFPAASAFYLDISDERHRSRVMGIKESFAALGGVIGPLLVVIVSRFTTPKAVFAISFGLILLVILLCLPLLKEPKRGLQSTRTVDANRAVAARLCLQQLVTNASSARLGRDPITGSG